MAGCLRVWGFVRTQTWAHTWSIFGSGGKVRDKEYWLGTEGFVVLGLTEFGVDLERAHTWSVLERHRGPGEGVLG